MPYRVNKSIAGNYYHVFNRGNNRKRIFFEPANYNFFLKKLINLIPNQVDLLAYCLMPNHYHLLIKVLKDDVLESLMYRLQMGYTKSINKKYQRTGALFEGRYKSILINSPEYLLHLSRYIHQNPIKAGLVLNINEWKYSSFNSYFKPEENKFVESRLILNIVGSSEEYVDFCKTEDETDIINLI